MTFGSLFAGIGGFDLGLERAGMECRWQVEIDDYASRVLAKHWPHVQRWGDVATFPPDDSDSWSVDAICAGPPCQPIRQAGHRKGKQDERWLWGECLRVVATLKPKVFVAENPTMLLRDDRGARSAASSGHWPRSGTFRSGTFSTLPPLVPRIVAEGSTSWPTPTSSDGRGATKAIHCKEWEKRGTNLPEAVQLASVGDKRWPGPPGTMVAFDDNDKPVNICKHCLEPHDWSGPLNPTWVEWLMGYPTGWTDLDASATPSSLKSLRSLGEPSCSPKE